MEENNNVVTTPKEGSKFGWGVLGFFFPLVGLILFLVWLKNKKKASKAAGIGALIGFILQIAVVVLSFMGVVSIFGFLGEPVIDNKDDSGKKTAEVIEDEEEEEEIDLSDPCNVKAVKGDKDYVYEFNFDETCETVSVLDDNNKKLFRILVAEHMSDNRLITNSGVELRYPSVYSELPHSFYKVDNSIILFDDWCSPGFCYVYVHNTKDNTGFELSILTLGDDTDMLSPTIRKIETDGKKTLKITVKNNDSAGLDPNSNNPRVKIFRKVRTCAETNIDELLNEYNIEAFPMEMTYTYKSVDGKISNNPTIEITKTIKDYVNDCANRTN